MTLLKYLTLGLIVLMGAAMAYVRLMPVSQSTFHVDPETVQRPSIRGYILVRDGGDIAPLVLAETKEALANRVEQVILATPRTQKLTGDPKGTYASYVTRSSLWGFPDVTTIKIVPADGDGVKLLIYARQVYGLEDLGVNRARVENWLNALMIKSEARP